MASGWNGAGSVVRTDGTRSGSSIWQDARDASVAIGASDHDAHDETLADSIEECWNINGETAPAANLSMAGFKLTNMGTATAATDTANLAVVQGGGYIFATTSGDGTNYTVAMTPAITSLPTGIVLRLLFHTNNTGPCDLAVNGLTADPLRDFRGRQLPPGEIQGNRMVEFYYTGSQFRMVHPPEAREGTVRASASATEESGWLFCDGDAVSRTDYVRLFDEIGTTYGGGDGSTTFNLPDLRGRVPAGKDDMGGTAANRVTSGSAAGVAGTTLGAVGGAEEHQLTVDEMPTHDHNIPEGTVMLTGDGANGTREGNNASFTRIFRERGGDQAHTNMQPSIILNYLIKA